MDELMDSLVLSAPEPRAFPMLTVSSVDAQTIEVSIVGDDMPPHSMRQVCACWALAAAPTTGEL